MANYFQTDDRDDYFATLGKDRKPRSNYTKYAVMIENTLIIEGDAYTCKLFCKRLFGLSGKQVKYGKWRDVFKNKGYFISEKSIPINSCKISEHEAK